MSSQESIIASPKTNYDDPSLTLNQSKSEQLPKLTPLSTSLASTSLVSTSLTSTSLASTSSSASQLQTPTSNMSASTPSMVASSNLASVSTPSVNQNVTSSNVASPKLASQSQRLITIRRSDENVDIVMKNFQKLYTMNQLLDCSLVCEGSVIKAHKIILSAFSDYFKTAFTSINANDNNCPSNAAIIIKDMKYSDLKSIIDYIYNGNIDIDAECYSSFLKAGESLKVLGLSDARKTADFQLDATKSADYGSASSNGSRRQANKEENLRRQESERPKDDSMPNLILLPALSSALLGAPPSGSNLNHHTNNSPIICQALSAPPPISRSANYSSLISGSINYSNGVKRSLSSSNACVEGNPDSNDYSSSEEIDIQSLSDVVKSNHGKTISSGLINNLLINENPINGKRPHQDVESDSEEEDEGSVIDLTCAGHKRGTSTNSDSTNHHSTNLLSTNLLSDNRHSVNHHSDNHHSTNLLSDNLKRTQPKARDFYASGSALSPPSSYQSSINYNAIPRPLSIAHAYYQHERLSNERSNSSSDIDIGTNLVINENGACPVPLKRGRGRPPRHSTDSEPALNGVRSSSTPSHLTIQDLSLIRDAESRRYSDPDQLIERAPSNQLLSTRLTADAKAMDLSPPIRTPSMKSHLSVRTLENMRTIDGGIGSSSSEGYKGPLSHNHEFILNCDPVPIMKQRIRVTSDGQTSSLRGRKPKLNYTSTRDTSGKNKCPHCPQVYYSTQAMADHVNNVHSKNSHKYSCKICAKEFSWKISLNKHLRKLHGEEPRNVKIDSQMAFGTSEKSFAYCNDRNNDTAAIQYMQQASREYSQKCAN